MSGPRVLYVEDSPVVGQFLRDALSFEGVHTVVAERAERALEILADNARNADQGIELVLCDQALPDSTGLELMKTIRERYPASRPWPNSTTACCSNRLGQATWSRCCRDLAGRAAAP